MKKITLITVLVLGMVLTSYFTSAVVTPTIEIDIDTLDISKYKEQWDQEHYVSFETEGINVTVSSELTKITLIFKETLGRDVTLKFTIPEEYISSSELGNIKSDKNITITWRTTANYTIVSFDLMAHQITTLTISKGDLLIGRLKKSVHNFWGYTEYHGDSDGKDPNIIIFINKADSTFEIDNMHIIVQYKTNFFGWYYPAGTASSSDTYYYVDDLGDKYRIVTHFKTNVSGDVKIEAFPGASKGVNGESVRGVVARFFISTLLGVKKILIDWFGDNSPNFK